MFYLTPIPSNVFKNCQVKGLGIIAQVKEGFSVQVKGLVFRVKEALNPKP